MFACPAHYGPNDTAAFRFKAFRINSVIVKDKVGIVAYFYPGGLLPTLDLPEVGDSGFLAGRRQYIS